MSIGPRMRNHVLELGRNQVCLSAVQSPVKSGTQLGLLWWGVFSGQRGRTRTRWYFPNTTEWIQSPALLRAQREAALSSLEPPIPLCGQGWKGPSPCRASGIRADRAHHLFSASLPESSGLAPSWDEPVFPACGLHFIYFFASCSKPLFFFLDRQGLAAPSGDVDLVEKNVLAVKQRAFLGLRFFKSQRFICFRKAEQWRLLVSRTHTCSLPRPRPQPPAPLHPVPHQGRRACYSSQPFWFSKSVNSELFGAVDPFENLMEAKEFLAENCTQMHIHNIACDSTWCMVVCVCELRIRHT